jgi:hypothetical protein
MSEAIDLPTLCEASSNKNRTPLFQWMFSNRANLSQAIREAGRPDWEGLAKLFGERGLKDANGHPPNAACCRQTWIRVTQTARRLELQKYTPGKAARQPAVPFSLGMPEH